MKKISLDGSWQLYYFPQESLNISHPDQLDEFDVKCIEAIVPGNVEFDLSRAGLLSEDLFFAENIKSVAPFSLFEFWYVKQFEATDFLYLTQQLLVFNGVDCLSEYWLNGEMIGTSKNMFISQSFDITQKIKKNSVNKIHIRLKSPIIEAMKKEYTPLHTYTWGETMVDCLHIRKAAHSFGWDIMPRALSAGIWRGVEIIELDSIEILDLYFMTERIENNKATINVHFDLKLNANLLLSELFLEFDGVCEDNKFFHRHRVFFKSGVAFIEIENPVLWWPKGYGDANLYNVNVKLISENQVIAQTNKNLGIRTVNIECSQENCDFLIKINNTPILCKGSNWVPADAFHSRDKERIVKILDMFNDLGCNIIRCWGGNVYEDHEFFDYCDKHGIMVWQDFAMACGCYPQNDEFLSEIKKEAEIVVTKLRNHVSIILWSGDNECDTLMMSRGVNPNLNKLTRDVLPNVVFEYDPYRFFYPSSPYITEKVFFDKLPLIEDHLWGPRDYYKSKYYTESKAKFISEIGYHGCPNLSSIKKFIDEEHIWPWHNNKQWILHSTNQSNNPYRINLMSNQIKELFGEIPENIEDYILASQISQGEAKKFFIEMVRINKWEKSGIIWWNVMDGWPQFSDAVVDYYFSKKIAYEYIKRAQVPVCIMICELTGWNVKVFAVNDSRNDTEGKFRIWDADTSETLLDGDFNTYANQNTIIGEINLSHSDKKFLLIEWEIDNKIHYNHYMVGFPPISLDKYRRWLKQINNLFSMGQ